MNNSLSRASIPALIALIAFLALLPQGRSAAQDGTPTPELPSGTGTPNATPDPARIDSPVGGQALQGSFPIEGYIPPVDFAGAELSFAYQSEAPRTWFLIAELNEIPGGTELVQWDTTTLTDGVYMLRLLVTYVDGSQTSATIDGLRVRNYSPVETITPTPATPTATPEPGDTPVPNTTSTPTLTPLPLTPTALPPNPAQINQLDILANMGKGALAILAFLSLMGIYQTIKSRIRGGDDRFS